MEIFLRQKRRYILFQISWYLNWWLTGFTGSSSRRKYPDARWMIYSNGQTEDCNMYYLLDGCLMQECFQVESHMCIHMCRNPKCKDLFGKAECIKIALSKVKQAIGQNFEWIVYRLIDLHYGGPKGVNASWHNRYKWLASLNLLATPNSKSDIWNTRLRIYMWR